jgi:uncharacterized protein YjbJ (UPF0337 family)
MKAFPWILAGVAIGMGVTFLVFNSEPGIAAADDYGYDSVEHAARKSYGWGAKTRVKGKAGSVAGAIKEGVGRLTGDQDLADEGTADRVAGKVADVAGKVGTALGQTIHDLNR